MSTKTSIKRIAAVAAAALTIAGFSAVSAHASANVGVANSQTIALACLTADGGTQTADKVTCNGIAGPANTVTLQVVQDSSARYSIISTGGTFSSVYTDATVATTGTSAVVATGSNAVTLVVSTPTVGTITVAAYKETGSSTGLYSTTATKTVTITVNAASTVGSISVANTKSYITDSATVNASVAAGLAASLSADATVTAVKTLSGTQVATVQVKLKDTQANGGVKITGVDVSASVSGSGLIAGTGTGAYSAYGTKGRSATSGVDGNGVATFAIYADGTSGTGTFTFSYTDASYVTTVLTTKTVTFYSTTIASIKNTQILKVGSSSGATLGAGASADWDGATFTTAPAFEVQLLDSNGNSVANNSCSNVKITSSDATVFSATVANSVEEDANGLNGPGYCGVSITSLASTSGSKATITPYVLAADGVTKILGTPMDFTVGGTTVYGAVLTTDADSYAPGDKVTLSLKLSDKAGNSVADGSYPVFVDPTTGTDAAAVLTPTATITSNPYASTTGNVTVIGGVKTASFYAPYSSGTFKLSGTISSTTGIAAALQATAISVSAAITNPADASAQAAIDAAQEATDAANAAYDAANNAMDSADAATAAAQDASDNAAAALAAVTSLSATVAKLVSSVASITAALASIKKKLGVK